MENKCDANCKCESCKAKHCHCDYKKDKSNACHCSVK